MRRDHHRTWFCAATEIAQKQTVLRFVNRINFGATLYTLATVIDWLKTGRCSSCRCGSIMEGDAVTVQTLVEARGVS
jgi:hypothetical protein